MRSPISRAAALSSRIRSCSPGSGAGQGKTISSWISPRNSDLVKDETSYSGCPEISASGRSLHCRQSNQWLWSGRDLAQRFTAARKGFRAPAGGRPAERRRRGGRRRAGRGGTGRDRQVDPCSRDPRAGRGEGFTVFVARGAELERGFSFGVVRQLFEAHVSSVSEAERERILSGAAHLAWPRWRLDLTDRRAPAQPRPRSTPRSPSCTASTG